MAQVPQHPSRQVGNQATQQRPRSAHQTGEFINYTDSVPQQQGLGAPVAQSNPNQYFVPNQALQSANGRLQAAHAQQAKAQAKKTLAEAALLQDGGGQGLGNLVQEQLQGMTQAGQLDPAVADAAIGMAQSYMQRDQAQAEQAVGGLGSF